jgi:hypothetical protein
VLSHGQGMVAGCLAVPPRDARESMRDVFNLDIER